LGTLEREGGVNFAIFSRYASRVRLELFDHPEDAAPAQAIDLDSARHRTGDVWHVWVLKAYSLQARSSAILVARTQVA
jgi:isoamylase